MFFPDVKNMPVIMFSSFTDLSVVSVVKFVVHLFANAFFLCIYVSVYARIITFSGAPCKYPLPVFVVLVLVLTAHKAVYIVHLGTVLRGCKILVIGIWSTGQNTCHWYLVYRAKYLSSVSGLPGKILVIGIWSTGQNTCHRYLVYRAKYLSSVSGLPGKDTAASSCMGQPSLVLVCCQLSKSNKTKWQTHQNSFLVFLDLFPYWNVNRYMADLSIK